MTALAVASKPLTKLAGRLTRCLSEGPREIGLAGKVERQRYVHQCPITVRQQDFRAFEALCADIAMRRFPGCLPEGSRKMISAQACNFCDALQAKIALQVCRDIVQHAPESSLIEPLARTMRK